MKRSLRRAHDVHLSSKQLNGRSFATRCRLSQQPAEHNARISSAFQDGTRVKKYFIDDRTPLNPEPRTGNRPRLKQSTPRADSSKKKSQDPAAPTPAAVGILIDQKPYNFSPVLLRDLCECPSCIDSSTNQKFFSTADIPANIRARAVAQTDDGASILWDQDLPGYGSDHTTELRSEVFRNLARNGFATIPYSPGEQVLWDAKMFNQVMDIDYQAYMQDDLVLYKALQLLHTHGLLFVSNVPESENSVSAIGERIGPIKNTFYGYTWDVRSVPEAKNVAYTAQDLGFHMDLLYMHQPPHLQLLHCIRSSARGGASLFADSYRAAQELFESNVEAFSVLAKLDATFHYNHPTSHLYRQQRPVFEMKPLRNGNTLYKSIQRLAEVSDEKLPHKAAHSSSNGPLNIINYVEHVSWSPPFQGPFSLQSPAGVELGSDVLPHIWLNARINKWHAAAREYSALIHRPEGIYERMMRPGECVIFDNRRVLHARKAFEVGDAGTERWLRGAYLDKDPYMSKLRVLQKNFGDVTDATPVPEDTYFEAVSTS